MIAGIVKAGLTTFARATAVKKSCATGFCATGLVFAAAVAAQQQPARDAVRVERGSATVAGTVLVDGDPKKPARRVRVTLTSLARTSPGQTTTTDDRGAFAFRELPAGRYELQGFKNAYLRASYGASRPDRTGTPIAVKDGETIANLTMSIVRGGVITGTVRDRRGRPVPNVNVRVLRFAYDAITGERTLRSPSVGSTTMSDDRGEYRAYGLPPGGYVVLIPPPATGGRADEPAIRRLTSDDVRRALQAARSGRSNVPGSATSIPLSSSGARVTYAPIFHPGVTDISAAAVIPLAVGEERAGIDVTTELVPTATVTVTVTSPSGPIPSMLIVRLVPAGPQTELLAGAGLRGQTSQRQGEGTYVFTGVPPGSYVARASTGWGRGGPPNVPTVWAAADVFVSGDDQSVPLTLQPGVPVNGRVVFEGGSQPTAAELQQLSFMLAAPGSGGQLQSGGGGGRVDAEGRFSFASLTPDAYRLVMTWSAASAIDKWSIKSATANGHEAFEAPLRVNANEPVELTITFTNTPATLTGGLQEEGGRAATEYYILVFSTNHAYWTPGSRRIRMTRAGTDGTYTVKGLPAGEYFLAALLDLETGEWNDPTLLDGLVKSSVKITLRDGETTTQHFRMGDAK